VANIIQAENVSKIYHIGKVDVPAVVGVSLSVAPREFVSIVGPSGSGKSTLFYILGGLTQATSGRVLIDGADFTALSDAQRTAMRKSKIGFVFQKFNLLPSFWRTSPPATSIRKTLTSFSRCCAKPTRSLVRPY
jgi:putative ABC transport system ATP-binding protein